MVTKKHATNYIEIYCKQDERRRKNIEALDKYDFGSYLTHGRSLSNMQATIEKIYDSEFYDKFGFFTFDNLTEDEVIMYFTSRYNIHFDEFIDYVIRHDDGYYEMAHKVNQE